MSKIMLVDDDYIQRFLYNHRLAKQGYEVTEASNGEQALNQLGTELPDLIILDINMPGMNGLETLARIHDFNCNLPVILHTAHAFYAEKYMSWVADAYVVKSSNLEPLVAAIKETLETKGHRLAQEGDPTNATETPGRNDTRADSGRRQG